MAKSPDAFRTISEVADWLETQAHVLRFWESKFPQVKPVKRAGGRRYYRPADMLLLGGIKHLLHDEGMTIKGAQKLLREQGVKHVSGLSQPLDDDDDDVVAAPVEATVAATDDVAETVATVTEFVPAPTPPEDPEPEVTHDVAPDAAASEDAADDKDEDDELPAPESLPAFLQRARFDTSDLEDDEDDEDDADWDGDLDEDDHEATDDVAQDVAEDEYESVAELPAADPQPDHAAEPPAPEILATQTDPAPDPQTDDTDEPEDDISKDRPSGPLDSILLALMKRNTIPAEHRAAAQEALTRLEALAARLDESAEG